MADVNGTMMQYFHWYIPADGTLWEEVKNKAADLAQAGFTALWLPPAYKGQGGGYDVGYGVYDLFDLGEFAQKNTVRTKYGTREQLLAAVKAVQNAGMQAYADVVLNHKDGGDNPETVKALPFSTDNRNYPSGDWQQIEIYTNFTFPGRGSKHSSMEWHWWHFDAVNHRKDRLGDNSTVYLLEGKNFDNFVDLEKGNYSFLMACDLDMEHEQVQGELKYWGEWFLDTTGVDGFRLDAIKHIPSWFYKDWLNHVRHHAQQNLFTVGEYWSDNIAALHWYISATEGKMSLFDVPLHYNFHRASKLGGYYDMRNILNGTLMQQQPALAVTFVENHDSQPLQSLESVVESWFKPLAYAIILLRREGYPCVFYADYYGAHYKDKGYEIWLDSHRWLIDKFLHARQNYAYGNQYDYFDDQNIIGWTRLGNPEHPKAMAVLMSDGPAGSKWMEVGKRSAIFHDLTEHIKEPVHTNGDGWGEFRCNGGSVSVWLEQ
ncbi:alpha-amylase [Allocoleopsis franciscana]|uniref:Glycosidase n=1 Tax=Allocoleopsis franciscana PCC 7113 TaxID=1173027 RepID=K9WLB4_9CYAN|nr:alpha-amylase [Allocoleopsis franciscana]AFZ20581.1 glycosidase [Allocoleopsis franciscana PCC 7113]